MGLAFCHSPPSPLNDADPTEVDIPLSLSNVNYSTFDISEHR